MENNLIAAALQAGAFKATILSGEKIVLSESFREICRTGGCGAYGRCWVCPPYIGEIQPLMETVRSYPKALWYQSVGNIEDSFDFEGMMAAGHAHAQLSQRIQQAVEGLLPEGFLHLSCGGCHLCDKCTAIDGKPCRFPGKVLHPLEGYGVDVYQTTKDTPLKYSNGQNTVTYFGMILYKEETL